MITELYSEFSLIESRYLLFENNYFKVLRWSQDPLNIQNGAEGFGQIAIIFAVFYFHRNFPLRFRQCLQPPLEFQKAGRKACFHYFLRYDVINCLNKMFITHFA